MASSSAASHISTAPSTTRFVTSSTVSPSGDVKPDASHVLFVSLPVRTVSQSINERGEAGFKGNCSQEQLAWRSVTW